MAWWALPPPSSALRRWRTPTRRFHEPGKEMGMRFSLKRAAFLAAVVLGAGAAQAQDKSLAQQIFEAMAQDPGAKPGYRVAHAKGIVCEGTFVPSAGWETRSPGASVQCDSPSVRLPFVGAPAHPPLPRASSATTSPSHAQA